MSKLRESQGDMYEWVTDMWTPVKGCSHDCKYCYCKRFQFPLNMTPRFDRKQFDIDLGSGKCIFVCHTGDLFCDAMKDSWIKIIVAKTQCNDFFDCNGNQFMFQSKNPSRMLEYEFKTNSIIGTTIETNRNYSLSKAPPVSERAKAMSELSKKYQTFVTIKPICDFDLQELVDLIKLANPKFVNIGADSKHCKLPEPSKEKVQQLIESLSFTEIRKKNNLSRLLQ